MRQGAQGARLDNEPTAHVPGVVTIDGNGAAASGSALDLGAGLPDMIVTDITWTPASPVPNDQVVFSAVVQNIGPGPTPDGTIVDCLFTITLAGVQVARTWEDNQTSAIASGASVTMVADGGDVPGANYWVATAGTYQVDAYVNGNVRFTETDRTNNHRIETVTVGAAPPTAPDAPVLNAVAGNGTVACSWNAPANNGSTITSYRLRRDGVILNPPDTTTTALVYTDNTVTNNVAYSYTVAAVNAVGEGPPSTPVVATPFSGGGVPVLLADILNAVPASNMVGTGDFHVGFALSPAGFATYKANGWAGFASAQYGAQPSRGQNSSAENQLINTTWAWQRSSEGWQEGGVNVGGAGNQNAANLGIGPRNVFVADASFRGYLNMKLLQQVNWFDNTEAATIATQWGEWAAGSRYLGLRGFYTDSELQTWSIQLLNHCPAGTTRAAAFAKVEQRGYEVGLKVFTSYPACSFLVYFPVPSGTLWDRIYRGSNGLGSTSNRDFTTSGSSNGSTTAGDPELSWFLGIMRAGQELGSTGSWSWLDHHIGYRNDFGSPSLTGTLDDAINVSWQGMIHRFSADLTAAQRDHWMGKINWKAFSWGDSDGTAGSFYTTVQQSPALYNACQATFRKWSGEGERVEFIFNGYPDAKSPALSQFASLANPYNAVPGRTAMYQSMASTATQDSTPITVGAVSQSRAFNTVTLTFTAAHPYGIGHAHWKLFAANGTTVSGEGEAALSWSLINTTPYPNPITTTNSFMTCTCTVPNATAGLYVTLDVFTIVGQRTSRRVALV